MRKLAIEFLKLSKQVTDNDWPGICAFVDTDIDHFVDTWPGFSGNTAYPVPHPTMTPEEAFHSCKKWSKDAYGDARRDLCLHIYKELSNDI